MFAVIAERGDYTQLTVSGSELINWYLTMAYPPDSATVNPFKCSPQVYTEFKSSSEIATHSIVINSILAKEVKLDDEVVVLNSNLSSKIHVGSHSFLNGILYPDVASTATASTASIQDVIIPSNMVIQGFWVHKDMAADKPLLPTSYGIMIWGVNDNLLGDLMEADATFCGQKWSAFLARTEIRVEDDDLWSDATVCNFRSL